MPSFTRRVFRSNPWSWSVPKYTMVQVEFNATGWGCEIYLYVWGKYTLPLPSLDRGHPNHGKWAESSNDSGQLSSARDVRSVMGLKMGSILLQMVNHQRNSLLLWNCPSSNGITIYLVACSPLAARAHLVGVIWVGKSPMTRLISWRNLLSVRDRVPRKLLRCFLKLQFTNIVRCFAFRRSLLGRISFPCCSTVMEYDIEYEMDVFHRWWSWSSPLMFFLSLQIEYLEYQLWKAWEIEYGQHDAPNCRQSCSHTYPLWVTVRVKLYLSQYWSFLSELKLKWYST